MHHSERFYIKYHYPYGLNGGWSVTEQRINHDQSLVIEPEISQLGSSSGTVRSRIATSFCIQTI